MSKKYFNISFPSDLSSVKAIITDTVNFIRQNILSVDESDIYALRLIYSELLCNAVIHGNNNDARKLVSLTVELLEDMVLSMIRDEGGGFDHQKMITEAKKNKNLYSNSGRGILIVDELTDSMAYNAAGNEIRFSKKVKLNG